VSRVGRLLEYLEESGQLDDTIVVRADDPRLRRPGQE
jgi:arylsulfatase A-like enzyme